MDFASFIGILSGISLVLAAILLDGDLSTFVNVPGMMIVVGGTLATTLLSFRYRDVAAAFRAAWFVFTEPEDAPNKTVATMVGLSVLSRREGLMRLGEVKTESRFLRKACQLIADSSEQQVIQAALRTEIESLKLRHFVVQDIFRRMGAIAPAFGMIGTLIGLVQMLGRMSDATAIGPAMAVALLTTFYGSLLSTMFFLPVAGKLKARTVAQVINLEIIFQGAVSILENNNPTLVYEKLSSYVPARQRRPLKSIPLR
jgi:chemotaxis protein MotA